MNAQHVRSDLTTAIVEAVAEFDGTDPADMQPPLYEVVDPEALDSLFKGASGMVTFTYRGHEVSVDDNGRVTVA